MALKLANIHPHGFSAPDAYWQAERITLNWTTKTLTVPVRCYASAQAMLDGHGSFDERRVHVELGEVFAQAADLSGPALDNALYTVLAERPEFAGAVIVPTTPTTTAT